MKTTIKNKTFGIMGTVGTMLMLGAVGTRAQEKAQEKTADAPATTAEAPPKPASPYELLVTAFDAGIDGWVAFGDGSKVSSTHEASKIKFGKGSLAFEYALEKGKIGGMILPVEGGKLAKMKSLRFWVRADHTLPLVVALQEKDGGRYTVTFTAPADQWQQVELAPEDFALASDKTDPKDPDGKLDLDKVENIGIMDMGVMFAQSDDATVAKLFNAPKGVHTLLLNEFVARSDAAPTTAAADKKTAAMDGLSHPQLGWFGLGGAEIRSATGKPLDGKSLKATYHQGGGANRRDAAQLLRRRACGQNASGIFRRVGEGDQTADPTGRKRRR